MAPLAMKDKYKDEINKMRNEAAEAIAKFSTTKTKDGLDDLVREEVIPEEPYPEAELIVVNTMTHIASSFLHFQEKKDWFGSIYESEYPQRVAVWTNARFYHSTRASGPGSMSAVVYVGNNQNWGSPNCAWLMAWKIVTNNYPHVPNTNKVYVETGPMSKYAQGCIDWDDIESKLENSSLESSYVDEETGAKAYAQISNANYVAIPLIFGLL